MRAVKARVREWGNSLGIIIPKETGDEAGLVKNHEVTIEIKAENPIKVV